MAATPEDLPHSSAAPLLPGGQAEAATEGTAATSIGDIGDLRRHWDALNPWAKANALLGIAQIVLSIFTIGVFGLSTQYVAEDPRLFWHFTSARNMLIPAFVIEACRALSSYSSSKVKLQSFPMSVGVMLEYFIKISVYSVMAATNGGFYAVVNARAFGPVRPCFTTRFFEWGLTVPIILVLNNLPFAGSLPAAEFWRGIIPSLIATHGYVIASWAGLATPNAVLGWILIIITFASFGLTVVDQILMVQGLRDTTTDFNFKMLVVVTKDVIFGLYGVIYCLGIANGLSPYQEQLFYTYGDVILKVTQVSVLVILRNWQDLAIVQQTLHGQISRSREDTARLIRKANALMLSMECDGCITGWNEHLASVTKISEDLAVGKYLQDLVSADSRMSVLSALQQCRNGLSAGGVELSLPCIDGRGVLEAQLVPIFASFIMQLGADTSNIIVVAQDLTEHVAQKALEERQGRFESIVSHELRSPLHGILGLSAAMADTTSDKMQKKQLSMIQGCADRLLDLVNNMMENSSQFKRHMQKQRGEIASFPQHPVNMSQIIREVLSMTKGAVDKAGKPLLKPGVDLVNSVHNKQLPVVHGDSGKLTQMLYNLTTNACKFTAKGWVSIDATHDAAAGCVELSVSDSGTGIAPGALKRIFEPFEQEDVKDTRNFQGVGLGLSVAQGIAQLHSGEIKARSVLGQGTTFTVRIKCDSEAVACDRSHRMPTEDELASNGRTSEHGEADRGGAPETAHEPLLEQQLEELTDRLEAVRIQKEREQEESGDKPLILSVDLDTISQQVVAQNLASCARVHQCKTGAEALAYLETAEERPKLVLIDLIEAKVGALQICLEIRQRLKLAHLDMPVIVFGSKSMREERSMEAFWAGATDILLKPFSANALRMRVNTALELQREFASAQASLPPMVVPPTPQTTPVLAAAEAREADMEPPAWLPPPNDTTVDEMARKDSAAPEVDLPEGLSLKQDEETSDRRAQEAAEALALCRSELEEAAASSAAIEMRLTEETLARAIGTAREEALQSDQARLEAALAESAANLQIAKSELAAALAAPTTVAAPPAERAVGGYAPSPQSTRRRVPEPLRSSQEVEFLRVELEGCYRSMELLRRSLCTEESEAYLQRERADSKGREVNHLTAQLRRVRRARYSGPQDDRAIGS